MRISRAAWRACLIAAVCVRPAVAAGREVDAVSVGERKVSGPYACGNLAVFLVHWKVEEQERANRYLDLTRALRTHTLLVKETGSVSELVFQNRSPSRSVYVQSGEIVKGGRQDRTIRYDTVVAPRSPGLRVPVFCVESGRWNGRHGESSKRFTAGGYLSTRRLRLAASGADASQDRMWSEVRLTQDRLKTLVDAQVRDARSPTSLQLTLESRELRRRAGRYVRALADRPGRWKHAVGFCFAVNGEIVGANVYASRTLFLRMWPKLLRACAVEAVLAGERGRDSRPPALEAVQEFFLAAVNRESAERPAGRGWKAVVTESASVVLFELRPTDGEEPAVHESYVRKERAGQCKSSPDS
jgi:hypothetical protein